MVNDPYDLPYSIKDGEHIRRTRNLAYVVRDVIGQIYIIIKEVIL